MRREVDNILLIDKPTGITSFDVIRILRERYAKESGYPVPKFGHAGTLDPLASGLMLIGVGEGTKKLKEYVGLPKEYVAEVLVGERRLTGDMEGKVLESADVPDLDTELVREELRGMIGVLRLPVSAYSAMKKGGVPMYKRARKAEREGKQVTGVPIRDMEVMEAELLKIQTISINRDSGNSSRGDVVENRCVVTVRFYVGSGTYIRSLAEELGRRLGYPATLRNLRRTRIGEFCIEDAKAL
jgi:tRNA pseudouridine55 synthase